MTAFGTVFMPEMSISWHDSGRWSPHQFVSSESITFHPGAHGIHYASSVFEGLKAFKHPDGSIKLFRLDQSITRFAQSSRLMSLPTIDTAATQQMILDMVGKFADQTPAPPGSMYIRPIHIGTDAAIGAAATPPATSCQYIMLSPVGDYFSGGDRALRLLIEESSVRCAPHMGMIKSGGNYASALAPILSAKEHYNADQILFCPNGDVQETGAANFLLIDGNEIITKRLDSSFLHGITRSSILTLAKDMGMTVSERELSVDELTDRIAKPHCEAALSGTAAVLTPVGTLIHDGKELPIGNGGIGQTTLKLRQALNDIQWGKTDDRHGWLTHCC